MRARSPPPDMREPASQFFRVFQRHPLGWLVILLLLVLATWLAHFLAERAVIEGLRRNGVHRLELYVTGLESELARYDYLPMVLTLNQDVIGVLKRPDNASVIALANRYLQRVNEQARTAAIYVLDPRGLVLASSNWNERVSFVGMDLSYRPYFQEALKGMSGRFYGIGTTSGDPGYYFSHGIYDAQRMLGVAAVKVSLDKLERLWTQGSEPVIVSDRYGVILLSSDPSWKFKTLRPISQETMAMFAATRQYDGATLEPIDLLEGGDKNRDVRVVTLGERTLLAHTRAMPETGWAVTILSDLAPARAFARNTAAAAAFAFGFLLLLLLYLSQRRRAIHASLAAKEALQRAHDELERKVAERTADLVAANQQLEGEVAERVRAEQVLRQAQEELVQAGKLAVLGQLSAGITHELNQPLAAMRTLSDNAVVRLDRNEPDAARRNLSMISSLVERMAKITSQLHHQCHGHRRAANSSRGDRAGDRYARKRCRRRVRQQPARAGPGESLRQRPGRDGRIAGASSAREVTRRRESDLDQCAGQRPWHSRRRAAALVRTFFYDEGSRPWPGVGPRYFRRDCPRLRRPSDRSELGARGRVRC
jgi:two-component system C4-dicarboxylate transport sensor histidine kinase DctB